MHHGRHAGPQTSTFGGGAWCGGPPFSSHCHQRSRCELPGQVHHPLQPNQLQERLGVGAARFLRHLLQQGHQGGLPPASSNTPLGAHPSEGSGPSFRLNATLPAAPGAGGVAYWWIGATVHCALKHFFRVGLYARMWMYWNNCRDCMGCNICRDCTVHRIAQYWPWPSHQQKVQHVAKDLINNVHVFAIGCLQLAEGLPSHVKIRMVNPCRYRLDAPAWSQQFLAWLTCANFITEGRCTCGA